VEHEVGPHRPDRGGHQTHPGAGQAPAEHEDEGDGRQREHDVEPDGDVEGRHVAGQQVDRPDRPAEQQRVPGRVVGGDALVGRVAVGVAVPGGHVVGEDEVEHGVAQRDGRFGLRGPPDPQRGPDEQDRHERPPHAAAERRQGRERSPPQVTERVGHGEPQ
jgi:hypothetical protein